MRQTPFDRVKQTLSGRVPPSCLQLLPGKWEKIGTVLVLKLPEALLPYKEAVGEVYGEQLGCMTTLRDLGGIAGEYRRPEVEFLWGSHETETMHRENGVSFLLDPQKVMFSSGNMAERKRMGQISNHRETVVDLFAGIGYFTIPMAVHSKPQRIYACEVNPAALEYLRKNIVVNNVTDIVKPLSGDNRLVAPKGCADRVLVGYLQESDRFLPVAFESLRDQQGILHYHALLSATTSPERALLRVQRVAESYGRRATLLMMKTIKSYAPGIDHVVFDLRIGNV